jgi:isocitrate dehydrogenase (NAD+)
MFRITKNLQRIHTGRQKVVLFPGNGIGPEIARSVEDIFRAIDIPIEFEAHQIYTKGQTEDGDLISY